MRPLYFRKNILSPSGSLCKDVRYLLSLWRDTGKPLSTRSRPDYSIDTRTDGKSVFSTITRLFIGSSEKRRRTLSSVKTGRRFRRNVSNDSLGSWNKYFYGCMRLINRLLVRRQSHVCRVSHIFVRGKNSTDSVDPPTPCSYVTNSLPDISVVSPGNHRRTRLSDTSVNHLTMYKKMTFCNPNGI